MPPSRLSIKRDQQASVIRIRLLIIFRGGRSAGFPSRSKWAPQEWDIELITRQSLFDHHRRATSELRILFCDSFESVMKYEPHY